MPIRIRHCVECPQCRTRYLIAFSPYRNRSYLVPKVVGSSEEFILYCTCRRPAAVSRWRWKEVKTCEISRAAYDRGYGSAEQVVEINNQAQEPWTFDIVKYLDSSSGKDGNTR